MVKNVHLALLGFGNVGQAFASLLLKIASPIFENRGVRFTVTGIATRRHGIIIDPDGVDLKLALAQVRAGQPLDGAPQHTHPETVEAFIEKVPAEVILETLPVDYSTGKPAIDYVRQALERGMAAITANKGTMVHGYPDFKELCAQRGTGFAYESTVLDGIPLFSLFRERLPYLNVTGFKGILNATSNLILDKMAAGSSFDEAVKLAQEMGIAETDPSGDIDGWDSAVKVAALVTALFDHPMLPSDVSHEGIRHVSAEDIAAAKAAGKRLRLVCEAHRTADKVDAGVKLQQIGPDSILYAIDNANSYVEFYSDIVPVIGLVEAGRPGPEATAYGMLTDLLDLIK